MTAPIIREWSEAFTRIGNALGLAGSFPVHFGYKQIEEQAKRVRPPEDSCVVCEYAGPLPEPKEAENG